MAAVDVVQKSERESSHILRCCIDTMSMSGIETRGERYYCNSKDIVL